MYIKELSEIDGIAQARMVKEGAVSQEEVLLHYRMIQEERNPELNAIVHEVKNADYRKDGFFAGLPFLIKDLNAVKGAPLTYGSKVMEGFTAPGDDEIVRRYKKAGLNITGKTNTPEFGFTPATESQFLGETINPWDRTRSPGGSSGGAAVAVAAGMVPFAHGSDGGGSLRIPASNTGTFGFKPTRGRSPLTMYLNSLSVQHALTTSVRDSAALLDVIEGPVPGTGYGFPEKDLPFFDTIGESPGKLKIAYAPNVHGNIEIDEEVQEVVRDAAEKCASLGHEVEEVYPDFDHDGMMEAYIYLWVVGGALSVDKAASANNKAPADPFIEKMLSTLKEKAAGYSALEYEKAREKVFLETQKLDRFFEEYDVLINPVNHKKALPLGRYNGEEKTIDEILSVSEIYAYLTPIANMTGQPAMSVPTYWTKENLPIGSHFQARYGRDKVLFQLARQLEEAFPWKEKYKEIRG
ncbi:amidase [Salimicrobium salexigens]|uniref:Amidase n=1 Tax=Salimicrobium salexigens TaxID=908941 RepID=A0ABY1KY64_9BACI|nr:amidase [Salimicrobium salexigens]SIS80111.1 amidase [Salimicrobium salexigens]